MSGSWQAGWATGDIVTTAEYKKGTGAVFDSTLRGAGQFDVSGIIPAYSHLRLVFQGRGDTAALTVALNVYVNGDSTFGHYDSQTVFGNAAVTGATEVFGANVLAAAVIPAATAAAGLAGQAVIDIPNYSQGDFNKTFSVTSGYKIGTATTNMVAYRLDGYWRSSAIINRVTIFPAAGNFVTGTRLTIHAFGA